MRVRKFTAAILSLTLASAMFGTPVTFANEQQQDGANSDRGQPQLSEQQGSAVPNDAADQTPSAMPKSKKAMIAAQGDGITALGVGITPMAASTDWYTKGSSPYTITNANDLEGFKNLVNSGTDFTGKTVQLAQTLTGWKFEPIGTKAHPFNGTFDGNGKGLANAIISPTGTNYVGLFGYAGPKSLIKDLELTQGYIEIASSSVQIKNVGTVVGYSEGDIENAKSNMDIEISSSLQPAMVDSTANFVGTVREVGGIAGTLNGNLSNSRYYGDLTISSNANVLEHMRYIVGNVGGLVGFHGDQSSPYAKTPKSITNSTHAGELSIALTGEGGKDRFGEPLLSVSAMVGGIAGYSSGNITGCTNTAAINTSPWSGSSYTSGRGAAYTGGIVGSLRGKLFEKVATEEGNGADTDPAYDAFIAAGGIAAGSGALPTTINIVDCNNFGNVSGLNDVGGIVGSSGSFSLIEGCGNTGDIWGCRWNKPFVGGIAGNSDSSIRYCYNQGAIYSSTGGGYYCSGITGSFTSVNIATTDPNHLVPTIEMTGCYTTGSVYTSAAGYRTGILTGENNGYIHANCYLPELTLDNKVVGDNEDKGTTVDNLQCSPAELHGSKGIAKLNSYAAAKGAWSVFYMPGPSENDEDDGYFPILSRDISGGGSTDIGSVAAPSSGPFKAVYSAAIDPVPTIALAPATLVQNADYRVAPQTGTKGADVSATTYTATIYGMGKYTGSLATVSYTIIPAQISDCTIIAAEAIFNWERQTPAWIKLVDTAGNEVPTSAYNWRTLPNSSGSASGVTSNGTTKFYDYKNSHGATYKYDVEVTSTGGNYVGSGAQPAFRIRWASLNYDGKTYNPPRPSSAIYDKVVFGKKEWDYLKALEDKTGDYVQITYTGKEILPTIKNPTYLGRPLRNGTTAEYWSAPYDYDFRYVYGNANPEEGKSDDSDFSGSINVSAPGNPTSMTIRFTSGGNFDNYSTVFYRIVPAAISSASFKIADQQYTGKARKPKPVLTFNGKKLKEGKDYTLSAVSYKTNKKIGKASCKITITGKGNFSGKITGKTVKFNIVPKKNSISKLAVGKKWLKVTVKKVAAKYKITAQHIRYRAKGATKWIKKTIGAKKTSLVIKGLKRGKTYEVQTRVAKGKLYAPWSVTKTSKKIK